MTGEDMNLTPFETAVRTNGPDLMRYLEGRARDGGDAAEAYGETLMTAWRARRRLPADPAEARMWLFGVARKVLLNNKRSHARRFAAVQRLQDRIAAAPSPPSQEDVIDVRAAIDALPSELAEVIRLTYWDGFASHEIAALLGVPASTVRTRISTARQMLENLLETASSIDATNAQPSP